MHTATGGAAWTATAPSIATAWGHTQTTHKSRHNVHVVTIHLHAGEWGGRCTTSGVRQQLPSRLFCATAQRPITGQPPSPWSPRRACPHERLKPPSPSCASPPPQACRPLACQGWRHPSPGQSSGWAGTQRQRTFFFALSKLERRAGIFSFLFASRSTSRQTKAFACLGYIHGRQCTHILDTREEGQN